MADEPETPATPSADKPAPRRRAARKPAGETTTPKRTPRKAKPAAETSAASAAPAAAAAPKRRAPAKPRAAKRATPATPRKRKETSTAAAAVDKVGGKWGAAVVAGGVAAAGVAAAALLSLRGSAAKKGETPVDPQARAHQPDGTDSTASFRAGIADENTIPEKK